MVAVKQGNGVVAVRFLCADGAGGQAPKYWLKWDGNEAQAARVVAYHYSGPAKKLADQPLRAAVLLAAAACRSDADREALIGAVRSANVQSATSGDDWRVSATVGNTELVGRQNLRTGTPTERKVNGQDVQPANFQLNNRDLASELLRQR